MHFGASVFKMVTARIRNEEWQQDDDLKDMLARYVKENLRRREILDFVCRDFDQYAWSLRSLDRRLEYFNIRYIDRIVELGEIETVVRQEMDGPGKLLGYRALHKKLRKTKAGSRAKCSTRRCVCSDVQCGPSCSRGKSSSIQEEEA